jgi:hypothetical protein
MAVLRSLLIFPNAGIQQCAAVDIVMEEGTDVDDARVIHGCPNPPAGVVKGSNSGICPDHIRQLDREGAWIIE